jgi:hypothetical protein
MEINDAPKLCSRCHESRRKWRLVEYDPHKPSEWPGTRGGIMDSTTSHAARRADWDRKTADQIALIERICLETHADVSLGEEVEEFDPAVLDPDGTLADEILREMRGER